MLLNPRLHRYRIEIAGSKLHYIDAGQGSPVLLLHGVGGCWQNWMDTIPHLARTRRVIAVDLPGFGRSELPKTEVSIPLFARTLRRLLDEVGITRTSIVGNSMGGLIALDMALRYPSLVDRMSLLGPAGMNSSWIRTKPVKTAMAMRQVSGPAERIMRNLAMNRPSVRRMLLSQIFHRPQRLRPDVVWGIVIDAGVQPGFVPSLRATLEYDVRHRMGEIKVPTLICWGRHDRVLPCDDAARFGEAIPHARVMIFEESAHLVQLEEPIRFHAALDEFLVDGEPRPRAEGAGRSILPWSPAVRHEQVAAQMA